jgi:hypothetical protein
MGSACPETGFGGEREVGDGREFEDLRFKSEVP